MIIRRLGDAIARQDWFVVLIELVVLVVGIFIGLQVDDWNQARKDRNDETQFLAALHGDIILADKLSMRVRDRRLDRRQAVRDANDVLFRNIERDFLTDAECIAISSSNYFNITITGLPSLEELIATGRLGIIRDKDLRAALMGLRETRSALQFSIEIQTSQDSFKNLPQYFPELFSVGSYFDEESDEITVRHECNLEAMRNDNAFLSQWAPNADGYDAYVRDGLKPWSDQFDKVHAIVDEMLEVEHNPDLTP